MTRVVINLDSEKSAAYLKSELEKLFPLLDGKIKVEKSAEIKPLDKVLEDIKKVSEGN